MPRRPDMPCSLCGTLMWRGKGSLPEGEATCRPCRSTGVRRSVRVYVPHPRQPRRSRKLRDCEMCGAEYTYTHPQQRTCSRICGVELRRQEGSYQSGPKYLSSSVYVRECAQCSTLFVGRHPKTRCCSDKCKAEAAYESTYGRKRASRRCARCTVVLLPTGRPGRVPSTCGPVCAQEYRRVQRRAQQRRERKAGVRDGTHRARAKRYGVAYEPIDKRTVYVRDGWQCGICAQPVDAELRHPNPMAASLDHVVPMSRGGGHLYSNVQLAHWQCNIDKGDRCDVTMSDLSCLGDTA